MRAVWSFWSRPFLAHKHAIWGKPLHHLLAWGMSVEAARRHYPETVLITDRQGKKLLADRLGLPFVHVSTELEQLADADPGWWALGKLVAYGLQDRPFVHIDTDVFLWKPLPRKLAESPVFAQCPEFHQNGGYASPADVEYAFAQEGAGLPVEWQWARSRERTFFREENCGILGGSQVDFLRHYARTAAGLVLRPEHAAAWSRLPDKRCYNMIVEQFFLSACVEYHRCHPASLYRGVWIDHVFPSWDRAFEISHAARAGFTHLLGDMKSHPEVCRRLEERVRREDPAYFRRCEKLLADSA